MFALKVTSDDENTPKGPRVLAREERVPDADRLIRTVDKFIVQDLLEEGKKYLAKIRGSRAAPPLKERNPFIFLEIPKGMPIQFYDADWFNNRPPHARAKLAAQLIVAFVPNDPGFLSGRGDNGLTIDGGDGEDSGALANSDDSGESVGSHDSNDESDGESVGSFITDDEGVVGEDEQGFRSEEENNSASFAASYYMDLEAQIFDESDDESM
ncbi:hypothetical protein B0H10DRAFT_2434807 [Mycena sp. CBHHK59/15]|nr:hypothetical protein B0H10DRAFT_2434807 [Mycena sp. CBHHK59/15]